MTKPRTHYGKVIFEDEIAAKIALARRVWKDKGEIRHYPCFDHWHLTSEPKNEEAMAA